MKEEVLQSYIDRVKELLKPFIDTGLFPLKSIEEAVFIYKRRVKSQDRLGSYDSKDGCWYKEVWSTKLTWDEYMEMKKKEAVGDFSTRSKWILVGVNQDAAILEPYFFLPYKMNEKVYCDESRLGLIVRFEEDKSIMSLAMLKANRLGDKTKARFLWGSYDNAGYYGPSGEVFLNIGPKLLYHPDHIVSLFDKLLHKRSKTLSKRKDDTTKRDKFLKLLSAKLNSVKFEIKIDNVTHTIPMNTLYDIERVAPLKNMKELLDKVIRTEGDVTVEVLSSIISEEENRIEERGW